MTDCSTFKSWISDFRIRRRPWRSDSHGRLVYPRVHRSLIPRREFPSGYYPSGPYVFLYIRDFQLGKVNHAPCQTYFSAYDSPPSLYLISTAALGVQIRWRTELPAHPGRGERRDRRSFPICGIIIWRTRTSIRHSRTSRESSDIRKNPSAPLLLPLSLAGRSSSSRAPPFLSKPIASPLSSPVCLRLSHHLLYCPSCPRA